MSDRTERLYELLPAIHRVRDAEGRGERLEGNLPLRALLSVVAGEVAVVEEDLAQLYDDLFIETCAEWVVPYIGDLVGVGGLHDLNGAASRRAQVANTVAYRRRKGTVAVLESLARDATGWPAHAVEFFQSLATTQHVNHVRPSNLASPDLRLWEPLEYVGTPFDETSRTADVRRIAVGRGRHNIPNVGVFLWRLGSYPLTLSPAVRLRNTDTKRHVFDPLGTNTQLHTNPEPEPDVGHLSRPINVPMPVNRRVLHEQREAYYGAGKSISLVGVYRRGTAQPSYKVEEYGPDRIASCNLDDAGGGRWAHEPENGIAVDPVLGRIFISVKPPQGYTLARLLVTYHYAFGADVGGGEYDRAASISTEPESVERVMMPEVWEALEALGTEDPAFSGVARDNAHPDIRSALTALGTQSGVVEVLDSGRYQGTPSINLGPEQSVEIRAADGHRPTVVLNGDLKINGGAEVTLNGLLVVGGALEMGEDVRRLRLEHCTLVPGVRLKPDGMPEKGREPSLKIKAAGAEVEIDRCVLGGMRIEAGGKTRVTNSILDATDAGNVAYAATNGGEPGGRLSIENSTVIGGVNTEVLELASNVIFLGKVTARRRQQGCVRFSYLPPDSRTPRRHQCHPEGEPEEERMRPRFVSLRYGDPAYCQLSR
ncbi:MAG: hypothetical protein M3522_12470, partial [Actinomycetota bacterium]|nr:hypothetical protein [Actinomycetota bacterium]